MHTNTCTCTVHIIYRQTDPYQYPDDAMSSLALLNLTLWVFKQQQLVPKRKIALSLELSVCLQYIVRMYGKEAKLERKVQKIPKI